MDKEQVISKLNWFYSLELNQVDLYNAQSKAFKGRYSGIVFERCANLEQQHVDNIGAKIKELGGNPTVLGDIISPIVGRLGGELLSLTGLENTLMVNILIEQKAMKDYNQLIEQLHRENFNDKELLKILQHNFVDEHLHTEWFRTKLLAMKHYEFSVKHYTAFTATGVNNHEVEARVTAQHTNRQSKNIKPIRIKKTRRLTVNKQS